MALFSIIFLTVFCVMFWCFVGVALGDSCNFNVKLKQTLRNEGIHRNITYGIVFNADDNRSRWMYQGCILGIDQTLPRGVYANPDELNDLRRQGRVNAVPKNKINVEMPAEDSGPSGVYVIGRVTSSKLYMWLPVHARYHRAKAGGGTARNVIQAPKLFLRCPDQRLVACDKDLPAAVPLLCNGSSKEKCNWRELPYTVMSKKLTWDMPVGNTDHYYIVATGTAAAVVIGSLYLMKTIHEYKLGDRKKHLNGASTRSFQGR